MNFPLAADLTKQVSRDYGILIEDEGIALRGLFMIDPEGELKYQVVNHNDVGRSVDETMRVLQALQWRLVPGQLDARGQEPGCLKASAKKGSNQLGYALLIIPYDFAFHLFDFLQFPVKEA